MLRFYFVLNFILFIFVDNEGQRTGPLRGKKERERVASGGRRSPHLILFRLVSPKEIVTGSDMRTVNEERWTFKDFVYTSD